MFDKFTHPYLPELTENLLKNYIKVSVFYYPRSIIENLKKTVENLNKSKALIHLQSDDFTSKGIVFLTKSFYI
jgi:hypothetical protein